MRIFRPLALLSLTDSWAPMAPEIRHAFPFLAAEGFAGSSRNHPPSYDWGPRGALGPPIRGTLFPGPNRDKRRLVI